MKITYVCSFLRVSQKSLDVIFLVVMVSVYRLGKIWNSPRFPFAISEWPMWICEYRPLRFTYWFPLFSLENPSCRYRCELDSFLPFFLPSIPVRRFVNPKLSVNSISLLNSHVWESKLVECLKVSNLRAHKHIFCSNFPVENIGLPFNTFYLFWKPSGRWSHWFGLKFP